MYRYFLSWRYLKSRRTNWIGIVGIFVAVGALILILSIMTGFLEESRKTIRGSLSDLIITRHPSLLFERGQSAPDPRPLVEHLRADPRISAASAHLVWFGLLLPAGRGSVSLAADSMFSQRLAAKLVGVDPDDEAATTAFRESLTRPTLVGDPVADPDRPFAPPANAPRGRPRPAVVVGEKFYLTHDLRVGQVINVGTMVPSEETEPEISNREFVVAGTFRTRENEMDLERIYFQREDLARFLAGVDEDAELPADAVRYTEVLVRLKDYARDAQTLRTTLADDLIAAGLLEPFEDRERAVRTWEDYRKELLGAIRNERALMGIMLSLVLLVAGFTIFAILSMMVTEKRRDIGILTALGATPRGVMHLFLLIGFWDALIGATAGAVAGTILALRIDPIERWLSSTIGLQIFDRNVYLFDHIPSVVEPVRLALIVLGAFACALAFAAIPAWKAASLDPLDALRYE